TGALWSRIAAIWARVASGGSADTPAAAIPWSATTTTIRGCAGGRGGHLPCAAASHTPSSASLPSAPVGTARSACRATAARRASVSGAGTSGRSTPSSCPGPFEVQRQARDEEHDLVAHPGQRGVERAQLVAEQPSGPGGGHHAQPDLGRHQHDLAG